MSQKKSWQELREEALRSSGSGGGPSTRKVDTPCPYCGMKGVVRFYYMVRWFHCFACDRQIEKKYHENF